MGKKLSRLHKPKINGQQQQQLPTSTAQPPHQQQQYSTTCNTMPAMPKEKATAVSLSENNFSELKLKELSANSNSTSGLSSSRSTCGCGAESEMVSSSMTRSGKYLTNGHSPSPLAVAVTHSMNDSGGGGGGGSEISSANVPSMSNGTVTPQCQSSSGTNSRQQYFNGCCRNNNSIVMPHYTEAANVPAAPAANTDAAMVMPPKKTPKDFIFGKYIGEGSFSTVYLGVDINTKREYAIKVCEKSHILRECKQEYVRREREVLHIMSNTPGFVNLSCTFQDNRSLYFVMTYAKKGDLLPYINRVGSFDVNCTRHYAAELVLACEQLHRRNVVHRDLKPENILLDEDMHTLIADFGSAKILTPESSATANNAENHPKRPPVQRHRRSGDNSEDSQDDVDSPVRRGGHRRRQGSFVGTAQYVSPEVLTNGPITPAADLWALGCIVYQMISGLPPFRGGNDYVIFRQILDGELEFPTGFDEDAKDLVKKLLKRQPQERLGAQDQDGYYKSIREHPFFWGIDFDTVREETPPPIYPYLPGVSREENFCYEKSFRLSFENLEPGLDDKQLTRLLSTELGTTFGFAQRMSDDMEKKTFIKSDQIGKWHVKNIFDLTPAEKQKRLEAQKDDKWHEFADNEVILKKGYVNKRKGLFARKRMLLLTTGPRLIYIDPVQMVKKGEIPWSSELRVDPKNFKIFFVHTPSRTYYLEDPEGYSLTWVEAINMMSELTYGKRDDKPASTTGRSASPTQTTTTKFSLPPAATTPVKTASD